MASSGGIRVAARASRPAPTEIPDTDFLQQPLWWDDAPLRKGRGVEALPACDVAIVGGGFAGLATALELARHGVRVTVLEADAFGFNASGRNSGGVSFGLDLAKIARWRRWTSTKGPSIEELARGALDSLRHLEAFIADNAVDCDYHRRGRLSCAPSRAHYERLAGRVDRLNALFDADAYMVPRERQAEEIGAPGFHGAMVIERSGQLHPGLFLRRLVELCEEAGAALVDSTCVTAIDKDTRGFVVRTHRGDVAAASVVVATNAHAARLAKPNLGGRVVPVASHIVVTEPLSDALADGLIPKRRTGADNRRLLAYFRRTPDGSRFLYGSRASPFEVSPEVAARILYRRMLETFPQLEGARITHAWGCKVAFTFDGLPHIGQADGIHYLMGCNGNGVAMMNYMGFHLARKLIEGRPSACVFDGAAFPTVPFYRGRPWFLPIAAGVYRLLDRLDS